MPAAIAVLDRPIGHFIPTPPTTNYMCKSETRSYSQAYRHIYLPHSHQSLTVYNLQLSALFCSLIQKIRKRHLDLMKIIFIFGVRYAQCKPELELEQN